MATPSNEAKDGKAFYGYLFTKAKPIPAPTPVFDALLRAAALYITHNIGDKTEKHLTPAKLAAFYKSAGHDWDSFFIDMPHPAIATVYQGLGCQHVLLPNDDDFAPPTVPALTVKGFVRWQTIQTLLGPQTQAPVLQFAAANWALKHPDTGAPLPVDIPREAFPSETDPDTDRWHQECAHKARMKAAEEEAAAAPKEPPKPDFAERKVPYSHIRVNSTSSQRDYFASRPVNVAYVHVPSPRATPTNRSPERERDREGEREHFARRRTGSTEDSAPRRRSVSDYPPSPHDARPVRVPRIVPEHAHPRRGHSQPRHYSSTSDSDGPPPRFRTVPRRAHRSDEPTPISIRRVYTGSSEESPRVVRTTMAPPPIPSHIQSPRPPGGSRIPANHDDSKRRSALFDLKEKISNFISTGAGGAAHERARSDSASRGRRDGFGSARGSREDILPSSRLSRSWSDIDTDDTDWENERRRFGGGRDYYRDRDRERERDRVVRERERDRLRDDRLPPRERDRAHSDSERRDRDRDRDRDRERDRDRDRDRGMPMPSPAASAAAANLHRDNRRRGNSDQDLSPRRWDRGPDIAGAADGGGHHRRTSSHADLDRLNPRRREWDHRDRERERERDRELRERDRLRDGRDRERDRDLPRFRDDGMGERWARDERLPRERERDRDRDRDRERDRMPSPALSGVSLTGVSGRKYPDIVWSRD